MEEDAALAAERVAAKALYDLEETLYFSHHADGPQPVELERCLHLPDAATRRARTFCLILAKRTASDGSMVRGLPAELWLHCAVMCPITTVQKWVRCRFADWVVASDENWHNGYRALLHEYQLALRRGAKDLTRKTWWGSDQVCPDSHLAYLESILSHDEWTPVEVSPLDTAHSRDELWAELAELLAFHPHLRTILNVPEEAMAEAWARHVGAPAKLSTVVDKWEYAERIVTRRSSDSNIRRWDAHCDAPIVHLLCERGIARPLFFGQSDCWGGGSEGAKLLGCMRAGFPADMNAASSEFLRSEYEFTGRYSERYSKVHCSLAGLFVVNWDVSAASTKHSGGTELLHFADSAVGTHLTPNTYTPVTRRQLVGDDFCAGLASLERQIVGADLSSADFRFLICF